MRIFLLCLMGLLIGWKLGDVWLRDANATITKSATISQIAPINLTSAGTAQVLSATDVYCSSVVIYALAANTGVIYIGSSAVTAANGLVLNKGDYLTLSGPDKLIQLNLKNIYFDGGTTNDDIKVSCVQYANAVVTTKGS